MRMTFSVPTLLLALTLAATAHATVDLPRPSPAATVSQRVGVADISVDYSSPGVNDRKIWGGLVPYGELWRTGANAATKITFSKDVSIGGTKVEAGTYALLTIPGEQKWTFILNRDDAMAGTRSYDKKKDALRAEVSTRAIAKRQRMTFLFAGTTEDSTELVLEWDELAVVVPISVATAEQAIAGIDASVKSSAADLTSSARYLLDEKEDAPRALRLAQAASSLDGSWVNLYVLARAEAANERYADAVATAKRSHALGLKADYFFWKDDVEKAIAEWSAKAK